jgi:hypothetical protein
LAQSTFILYPAVTIKLSIKAFSIMTFSIVTLSITAFSIRTLSTKGIFVTLSITALSHYANVIMPSAVMLNVVAPSCKLLCSSVTVIKSKLVGKLARICFQNV